MEQLTDNDVNATVFQAAISQLPTSHPCLKELKKVQENAVKG